MTEHVISVLWPMIAQRPLLAIFVIGVGVLSAASILSLLSVVICPLLEDGVCALSCRIFDGYESWRAKVGR